MAWLAVIVWYGQLGSGWQELYQAYLAAGPEEVVTLLPNPRSLLMNWAEHLPPRQVHYMQWSHSGLMDIGAYEYIPPMAVGSPGDLDLNHRVTREDAAWCSLCMMGPNAPYRTALRLRSTGEMIPAACWLADLDWDGDVDLRDYACQQILMD